MRRWGLLFCAFWFVAPVHAATMRPFRSGAEFEAYLAKLYAPEAQPRSRDEPVETVVTTGSRISAYRMTDEERWTPQLFPNNAQREPDQGDIVKRHGDVLVILRRGRLFTVSLAQHAMRAVDVIDIAPPGADDTRYDWYDEMVVAGDRIIVWGLNGKTGLSALLRFRIGAKGRLRFDDAYQLRGVPRHEFEHPPAMLVGDKLVLYAARDFDHADPQGSLPAMREWNAKRFAPIGGARSVYVAPGLKAAHIPDIQMLISCDALAARLGCRATSVLGGGGAVLLGARAAYVWCSYWDSDEPPRAILYRMPFDGSAPSALRAVGSVKEMRENAADGGLDVVLRPQGGSADVGWASGLGLDDLALLHVPPDGFGDGSVEIAKSAYRPLEKDFPYVTAVAGDYFLSANWLHGDDWKRRSEIVAMPLNGGSATTLAIPSRVERVQAIEDGAVAVGIADQDVRYTLISLAPGKSPSVGESFLAAPAEWVSQDHPLFFDRETGMLGIPVARQIDPMSARDYDGSATVTFLRRRGERLVVLGEVGSSGAGRDRCISACVDWYADTRPIFAGGRVFALMGYELAELDPKTMREIARLDFMPR